MNVIKTGAKAKSFKPKSGPRRPAGNASAAPLTRPGVEERQARTAATPAHAPTAVQEVAVAPVTIVEYDIPASDDPHRSAGFDATQAISDLQRSPTDVPPPTQDHSLHSSASRSSADGISYTTTNLTRALPRNEEAVSIPKEGAQNTQAAESSVVQEVLTLQSKSSEKPHRTQPPVDKQQISTPIHSITPAPSTSIANPSIHPGTQATALGPVQPSVPDVVVTVPEIQAPPGVIAQLPSPPGTQIPQPTFSADASHVNSLDTSCVLPEALQSQPHPATSTPLGPDNTSVSSSNNPNDGPGPVRTKRAYKKKKAAEQPDTEVYATIETDANGSGDAHAQASAPKKAPRKRKAKALDVDPNAPPKEPRKRNKRAPTPEDAEQKTIDDTIVKIGDLCKDIRIGKKFSKHDEIRQREMERKLKAKLAKDNPEAVTEMSVEPERPAAANNDGAGDGPLMMVVNGNIVLDTRSLILDRHARAAASGAVMEEVEENDFTRITTSATYMKRVENKFWGFEDTEKFYAGLRMFGTDFEMISKMFQGRNRRQIKLKFNKEERTFPQKVTAALVGEKVAIDLEEYKSHTGLEYEAVDEITAEQRRLQEEHDSEQKKHDDMIAETTRLKKAAIQGTGDSAKENEDEAAAGSAFGAGSRTRKPPKKKKRNQHALNQGGDVVEVLGSIDDM